MNAQLIAIVLLVFSLSAGCAAHRSATLDAAREANAEDRLADAARLWRQALLDCTQSTCRAVKRAVYENQTTLEYAGDEAFEAGRYRDAADTYGVVLAVFPQRGDVAKKLAATRRHLRKA